MTVMEIFEYHYTMTPDHEAQAIVIQNIQERFIKDTKQLRMNLVMWLYDL